MAARFGDANENGNQDDNYNQRRTTRHYEQAEPAHAVQFKEFTRDSLAGARRRKSSRTKRQSLGPGESLRASPDEPDPYLASGQQLSPALARQMPGELIGRPVEDIDPYYADKETFVIISRAKEITRFSAKKALYILGPFHPVRRVVLFILVSPIFNLLVILTILANCILMTIQGSETVEKTEIIFTIVYTTEMGLKVLARGFIIDEFSYLRDPWNWLDFAVIIMAYLTIIIKDLGNLSVMRTFRVLRALKTVAIIPGMKTIVGAVIDSVKNLKDVVVLTLFSLSVFSLLGLQIYMGILTQKCILNGPNNMSDAEWFAWANDSSHWIPEPDDEIWGAYRLCGNATGAQPCPPEHTCLQGFGPNPDYGYTNFDTFGWALICSFRLMTQDFWEGLYMQVLKTAGSWHIIFFLVSIFLGSIYLMNLILAIVAMSYNELQRRAEEEEEAAAQDEAAFLESCRLMELQDQLSQFSSAEPGASYRPSLEIGSAGQTLLASLCQNGLLSQAVHDKLLQQTAAQAAANYCEARSHSLSVHLERKGSYNPTAGRQAPHLRRHNAAYDPLSTAASMTELRRKSSVRTTDSGESPTSGGAGAATNRLHLGQRRLLPNIGLSGVRLDRGQPRLARRSFVHRSSNGLQWGPAGAGGRGGDSDNASETGSAGTLHGAGAAGFFRRFPARPSATSDRDLRSLKQRAAMIRIGSTGAILLDDTRPGEDCTPTRRSRPMSGAEFDADRLHVGRQSRVYKKLPRTPAGPTAAAEVEPSDRGHQFQTAPLGVQRFGSADFGPARDPLCGAGAPVESKNAAELSPAGRSFKSEAAICEQPTSLHPFGRLGTVSGLDDDEPGRRRPRQTHQQHASAAAAAARDALAGRLSVSSYRQACRAGNSARRNRRSSTVSHFGPAGELRAEQHQLAAATLQNLDASSRIVQQNNNGSSTTNTTLSSSYGLRAPRSNLFAGNQPAELDRMHRLSVENFQQFGAGRSAVHSPQLAGGAAAAAAAAAGNHLQVSGGERGQSQLLLDPATATAEHLRHGSFQGQLAGGELAGGELPGELYAQLRQRGLNISNLSEGRPQNVHPFTMVRSSFSRPRRSVIATTPGAGIGANDTASQATGAGPAGVRRMSKDFVRRASDWSRLSMSTNVDLRRLLKLWSYTNPYQGATVGGRPSVGSFSNCSQTGRAAYEADESPGHSASRHDPSAGAGAAADHSPRPSSVGSAWQAYEYISALSRRNNRLQSDARGAYASLPLDDSLLAERMSVSARDKCIAYCLSCLDIVCIWECCGAWLRFQKIIALVVFDPFTELFIILCILINTLFMALDSDDADDQMRSIFERGNYFFTATFAVEASMKILALSPKFYFREGWNVFDSIIVGLSLLELGLEGVYGLSVLRSFRLLRVFKLAKSWPTLNLLISIMGKAVGDLGNLTFVLAIIVFIFAVMGMQLFGTKYVAGNFPSGELPRWNFTDFMHSFMIVFRILCAEWIEPMWDCLLVGGWPCIPFFLIAVTVGNLVVLNLFLALLLASFGASNLSSPQADNVDTKKLQEAIGRFSRFGRWVRRSLGRLARRLAACLLRRKRPGSRNSALGISAGNADENYLDGDGRPIRSHIATMSRLERLQNIEKRTEELKNKIRRSPELEHQHLRQLARSQLKQSASQAPPTSAGGFNFHYHNQRLQTSPGAVPTIPIIVNEAPCDQVSVGDSEASGGGGKTPPQRQQQQQLEPLEAASSPAQQMDQTLVDSMQHYRVAETISETDEPTSSLSSDVSFRPGDFGASHEARPWSPASKLASDTTGLRQTVVLAGYSNSMQPIREDSKDDSCSSCSRASVELNASGGGGGDNTESNIAQPSDCANKPDKRAQSDASNDPPDSDLNQQQPLNEAICHSPPRKQQASDRLASTQLPKSKSDQLGFRHNEPRDNSLEAPARCLSSLDHNQQHQEGAATAAADVEEPKAAKSSLYLKAPKRQEMEEDDEKTLQHIESYIESCICVGIVCLRWFLFRQFVRRIVEHRYFDQCILILIVISSGTLALEDKHLNERPALKRTLDVLDTIFTIIFSLEMIFKWLAFGIRRYFGNIWSWLDFIIVLVSFVNLMASIFGSGKIQALKTMRTLRAMRGLRPLRALQRFQGMRVVVNALIQAIPSIFNVLLVCLIFWLIFSIMGVQMFGGKFWRCLDPETRKLVSYEVAANRLECLERNLTWSNPQINFDNVLNAYLALFQVATFKGWIEIMNSATDSRMRDDQPVREANIYMYFYFVFFVIFGSFFTLNLFIGVIIDNFNEQKKKTGGSLEIFMTDDQKKYYHAMKKMRSKKPIKAMTRPKLKFQAYMFDIITSKRFDLAIMLIIGLNMFVMALEHYGQSQEFSLVLDYLNLVFIAIFTLECLCKIFAMRHFYFREPWNIFDFIVVDLSLLGVVMKEYIAKYFVSPTLLRVVRVVKVGRVLRLVKGAKGIRTLLFALAMSLPALFNICLLLFLVMFIYAIFGMSFFMNVRKRSGIDETFNFETFSSSIIILFQMSTSAGWEQVLDPLMDEENDCQKPDPAQGIEGTCGNKSIAIFYLISYVIVTFLIIINMYIAVILENYSQATEDVQQGLTDDDYEMYYEIWQKFDPNGTQYLPYAKLSDFVDSLEDPLRIPKPNELALVVLDINIYQGNQCYCVDILDALTKYFFTRKGFVIQVNEHLQKVQSTLHETPFERVTTTYLLKREHYCAKVIQNCWRHWRERIKNADQQS